MLGLKSTALKFGADTKRWLVVFYTLAVIGVIAAGGAAGAGVAFYVIVAGGAGHLVWQIVTLDIAEEKSCLSRFRSNRDFGAIIFAALVADMALSALS